MATYTYESIESGEIFRIEHSVHDDALQFHPETGEAVKRIIAGAPALHIPGLKKHVQIDRKSPAATACGCASNVALAQAMYKNSRETPTYGSLSSKRTVTGGVVTKTSGCGHSHSHGRSCGHGH